MAIVIVIIRVRVLLVQVSNNNCCYCLCCYCVCLYVKLYITYLILYYIIIINCYYLLFTAAVDDAAAAVAVYLFPLVSLVPTAPALPRLGTAFKDYPTGLPADFTGNYELHSMVTHKGRSADSGHYIGWVRQHPGSGYWWKYDDDVVTEVDSEEIMRLKGGGDKDMTYLVFYRYKPPATD